MRAIIPKLEIVPRPEGRPNPGSAASGTSRKIAEIVQASLDDDKAEDPVVIDLDGKSSMADALIIASGRSARQVGAMADHLLQKLKAAGLGGIRIEGRSHADWVLIDAGDVIVHLFRPEVRAFYNLEKMWDAELPLSAQRRTAGLHTA